MATITSTGPAAIAPARPMNKGRTVVKWLTSTDHKTIGHLYVITTFLFFAIAGLLGIVIRMELFEPGIQVVKNELQYNQLFTMHGLIMLLLFATAAFSAFANEVMPLQIGAPDVAFPRLNMFSYWTYAIGGFVAATSLVIPSGPASFGWYMYPPLTSTLYSPGIGTDLGVVGLTFGGVGTILSSVNFITTIVTMRAPGMTMFRMPVFTWNVLITSILVILIFPPLAVCLLALIADRRFGTQIFVPESGGPVLWNHLFWFFGHPEVYVLAVPFFGVISEIIPTFSRKPIFGYKGIVFATIGIAGLGMSVWAHHMYTTGQVALPFFALLTVLIAVPTGVKFFNWIGTMWRGSLTFEAPMLFALGFITTFVLGGLTGIYLATPTTDFHLSDSYFVVGHFHYTLFGTVVFSYYAAIYYWYPKMTGRILNERLAKVHFWLTIVGFHLTFFVQHWLGVEGMPRRYADYMVEDGFTLYNQISTVGSIVLGLSLIPFIWNVFLTWRSAPKVTVDDPWGFGSSLEWATSCPPPRHNFNSLPRIRSERPAFDLHHPEAASAAYRAALPDKATLEALGTAGPDK